MRLLHLELADVGRFAKLSADLSGRLVGVVGENGAGKSTLLSAVYYAVTGDPGRLGRRQAVNLLRDPAGPHPFVRLTFLPGGGADPAVVVRKLPLDGKDGGRKLTHADRVWTAQADVDAQFEKWTGLTKKALGDVVFVAQGKLDEVVRAPAAQRAEVLHRAFGVDHAAKVFDACRDHLAGLPGAPDPAALDALRAGAAQALAAAAAAERDLLAVSPPDPAAEVAAQALISGYRRAEAARVERARAEAAVATFTANTPAPPDAARPDAAEFVRTKQLKAAWQHHAVLAQARDAATRRCAQFQPVVDRGMRPDTPPRPSPRLYELRGRRFALEVVTGCATGDACPVCSGPLAPDLADRDAARALLAELEALERAFAAAEGKFRAEAAVRQRERAAWDAAVRAAGEADAALAASPAPEVPEAEVLARDAAYVEAFSAWAAYEKAAHAHAARLAQARAALAALPEPPAVTREQAEAAHLVVQGEAAARAAYAAAEARHRALREAAAAQVEAVRRAEAHAAAAAHAARWRDRVERVRAVFHRDAAPADAARACLDRLAGDLNRRLEHLAARFRVRVDADGELVAEFRDGTRTKAVPADRLSGGEGCVLGLAWRLALLDRHAPKVALLCLDEPTTGLDADRVSALRSALEAWRPHGADRQFLIVTHERKLMSAFDQVVDLGAG